jgi:hypothetical protein
MGKSKRRGNSMALYAMFLVTVGIPMLAVGVDVARVKYAGIRLANSTQAACQAYANSLDIRAFREDNEYKFTKGFENAYITFHRVMPPAASFSWSVEKGPAAGVTNVEKYIIRCSGSMTVRAILPFYGDYFITANATAKTKFSTAKH